MTTACARFAAAALFCFFFLAFSNGARAADSAPDPSPFARTGLLVHPGETAEEILLRAHEFDAGAMALAVAGYGKGIGGFPKFRALATEWSVLASEMGLSRSAAFLFLLKDGEGAPEHDNSAEWLAACEYGKTSRLVPLFKEAGIFDMERECERLSALLKKRPGWDGVYRVALSSWASVAGISQERIKAARWLASERIYSPYYFRKEFEEKNFTNPDFFFFYVATTHDPEQRSPNRQPGRLLKFLSLRKEDNTAFARELARDVTEFMRRHEDDVSPAPDIVRRAHAGDTDAARAMSMAYLDGRMRFPLSSRLANLWLRRGAMAGDARNMELRAVQLYAVGDGRHAWVWAKLASEFGDADMRKRVEAILQSVERDVPASALEARRKLLEETRKSINDSIKMK